MRITKVEIVALTVVFAISLALIVPAFPMAQRESECTDCKAHCSAFIIGKKATADGSVIMGHTEDYGKNDCMHLRYHPRQTHAPGEVIHFSYVDIPQVPLTYAYTVDDMYDPNRLGFPPATFLDGMNEWGVSLSSNCWGSKEPLLPLEGGLGWSEMSQLVLERCKTASEAVELFTTLTDTYHFNGFEWNSCKYLTFLVADANEGWIIEVGPKHWAAKRCPDDGAIYYANQAVIQTDWTLASADMIDYAVAMGWYDPSSGIPFNWKYVYGANLDRPSNVVREQQLKATLDPKLGSFTVQDGFAMLRSHYEGTPLYDAVPHNSKWRTICVTGTQSPQLYHLRSDMPPKIGCVMWIGASAPCLGVFVPVYAGNSGPTPEEWTTGWDSFDPNSAWWLFEQVQRIVAPSKTADPVFWGETAPVIRERWDKWERSEFIQTAELEQTALKLWQSGKEDMALKLLTRYTYTNLHTVFLIERELLHWVWKVKGGVVGVA